MMGMNLELIRAVRSSFDPYQFCNLTEVVVRATDTIDDLERKVRMATILGTIQSTYTKFPYLRNVTGTEHRRGTVARGVVDRHHGQHTNDE